MATESPDPKTWDKMQTGLSASFLQSAGWARFQSTIGRRPHFLSGDGWSCLLVERRAPIGRYLFAPYGPTLSGAKPEKVFEELKNYGRSAGADWLRLEPIIKDMQPEKQRRLIAESGGRPAPSEVEPHLTRIVDLTRPEEEILSSLSQTTRNIIRRNQRDKSLTFKTSTDPGDISILTKMLDLVASRKGIGFFTADYYQKEADSLMPEKLMVLEIAYDGKQPAAAALIHDFGAFSSYTNAGSLPEFRDRNVSAPLLWQAMVNAKARGSRQIDLYGIAPDDAPASHPWAGFSSFKKKFGGEIVEHAGTWDLPLTRLYTFYRAGLKAKRLLGR